jgi:hypothetical protein
MMMSSQCEFTIIEDPPFPKEKNTTPKRKKNKKKHKIKKALQKIEKADLDEFYDDVPIKLDNELMSIEKRLLK